MSTSQIANLDNASSLATLIHERYVSGVQPHLEYMDPVLALFQAAGPGEFEMVGEKLVFAVDDTFSGGAAATGGYLPDTQYVDPVALETTPARIYIRRAVDNFWVARATGAGAFEDFVGRIMEQMWDAMERAQGRHVHGSSNGTVCSIATRSSTSVFTVDDGYGYTGVDPLMYLEPGMIIGWKDASNSYATGGAGKISAINYSTRQITMTASWENGSGTPQVADGDPVVIPTTTDPTATRFQDERGNAPLGLIDLIDPASAGSSYLGATLSAHPRLNPVRLASADFGEVEIMKFLKKIQTKSQSQVTPETHVLTTQEAVMMELARTLLPYTQIQQKGEELPGGWTTVRVGNLNFIESSFHIPNLIYALCRDDLRVVDLDGQPQIWAGDGSEFSRLSDYDGKEWFARHYVQRLLKRRNRCGALTGITTTEDAYTFSASPVF